MSTEFKPTHKVIHPSGFQEMVMLVEGCAYTSEEWRDECIADMEVINGEWYFMGNPFGGTFYKKV